MLGRPDTAFSAHRTCSNPSTVSSLTEAQLATTHIQGLHLKFDLSDEFSFRTSSQGNSKQEVPDAHKEPLEPITWSQTVSPSIDETDEHDLATVGWFGVYYCGMFVVDLAP
jgi:hypothetical protein